MTASQVARELGLSAERVRQLAREGKLRPAEITPLGQLWDPVEVRSFRRRPYEREAGDATHDGITDSAFARRDARARAQGFGSYRDLRRHGGATAARVRNDSDCPGYRQPLGSNAAECSVRSPRSGPTGLTLAQAARRNQTSVETIRFWAPGVVALRWTVTEADRLWRPMRAIDRATQGACRRRGPGLTGRHPTQQLLVGRRDTTSTPATTRHCVPSRACESLASSSRPTRRDRLLWRCSASSASRRIYRDVAA